MAAVFLIFDRWKRIFAKNDILLPCLCPLNLDLSSHFSYDLGKMNRIRNTTFSYICPFYWYLQFLYCCNFALSSTFSIDFPHCSGNLAFHRILSFANYIAFNSIIFYKLSLLTHILAQIIDGWEWIIYPIYVHFECTFIITSC